MSPKPNPNDQDAACPGCGRSVKTGWSVCPNCNAPLGPEMTMIVDSDEAVLEIDVTRVQPDATMAQEDVPGEGPGSPGGKAPEDEVLYDEPPPGTAGDRAMDGDLTLANAGPAAGDGDPEFPEDRTLMQEGDVREGKGESGSVRDEKSGADEDPVDVTMAEGTLVESSTRDDSSQIKIDEVAATDEVIVEESDESLARVNESISSSENLSDFDRTLVQDSAKDSAGKRSTPEGAADSGANRSRPEDRSAVDEDAPQGEASPPAGKDMGRTIPIQDGSDPSASPTLIDEGIRRKKVSDRYEILQELGRGGMGVVYRARDLKLGRVVALKRILEAHDHGLARFMQEARTVARLNHQNIVTVHDTGEDEIGPWLVMEYIKGGRTLENLIEEKGALPLKTVVSVGLSLCRALAYAHRMGVIHRDVKPGNVLLAPDGTLKLSDFGLAREGRGLNLSRSGLGMGTGGFAAPEQMEDAKNVDHRADIFGLGALLFQVSTGKRPHVIKEAAIPAPLRPILMKALAEKPADRFFDIDKMAAKLSAAAKEPPRETKKKRALSPAAVILMIVGAAVVAGAAYFGIRHYRDQAHRSRIETELYGLINRKAELKWKAGALQTARGELAALMDQVEGGDRAAAERFDGWIETNLVEARAIEVLDRLDDMDKDVLAENEQALRRVKKELAGVRGDLPDDFTIKADTLDRWYVDRIALFDRITRWEESKSRAQGDEEMLRSLRTEMEGWETGFPATAQRRCAALSTWLSEQLEPFDFLDGVEEERTAIEGDETRMRETLAGLLGLEKRIPEAANSRYMALVTGFEKALEFFDMLSALENRKAELAGDEEALTAAAGTLESFKDRVPETGRNRYDVMDAFIGTELSRIDASGGLEKLEARFHASDLDKRREDPLAAVDDLKAIQKTIETWKRDDALDGDLLRRVSELESAVKREKVFLEEVAGIAELLEEPATALKGSLGDMRISLEVFVSRFENEDDVVIRGDVNAARTRIKEIEALETLRDRQKSVLAVVFGAGDTDERVAAADRFLRDWPDHSERERVRAQVLDLKKRRKQEKIWDRYAGRGFRFDREARFTCGERSFEVEIYIHEKTKLEFVKVPAGTFTMGSPRGEDERSADEGPQREVTLKTFLLCRTEVTQGVWKAIMGSSPWTREQGAKEDDRLAASNLSWDDAGAFCVEAGLRLPSEAEWEYACRGGTEWAYSFGKDATNLGDYAWFAENKEAGSEHPRAVGAKSPNAYGLLDMHGNVYEWCQDTYSSDYKDHPDDGKAWEAGRSTKRVLRGWLLETERSSLSLGEPVGGVPRSQDPRRGIPAGLQPRLIITSIGSTGGGTDGVYHGGTDHRR